MAGGYSPSMLSAMRSAVITSKTVRMMHIDAERRSACSNSDPLDASAPGQSIRASEGSISAGEYSSAVMQIWNE